MTRVVGSQVSLADAGISGAGLRAGMGMKTRDTGVRDNLKGLSPRQDDLQRH